MLSRCQLVSHISKGASSLKRLTRTASPSSICLPPTRAFAGRGQTSHSPSSSKRSPSTGSLWSEESWDQVFEDLDKSLPPKMQPHHFSPAPPRRQTMTERESKVLTGMLDMIFESKEAQEELGKKEGASDEGGIARGQVDDLFSRLRQFSRHSRKELDPSTELLDKKKEAMSRCTTDQQLLEWAVREVFDESRRYEEAARTAMAEASRNGVKTDLPHLQSPIYPQLIAHLMRTFRVQFRDSNLALAIFNHAQNLSTVSYVFGCSTAAYNELIETRWSAFRDLEGVLTSMEEMVLNGVPLDSRTRKVVDMIRRDLGNKEILTEHSENTHAESWSTLSKIERLLAPKESKRKGFDQWKSELTDEDDNFDDWSFGHLDKFVKKGKTNLRPRDSKQFTGMRPNETGFFDK